LAEHNLSRLKPWESAGISRRTWERRRRATSQVHVDASPAFDASPNAPNTTTVVCRAESSAETGTCRSGGNEPNITGKVAGSHAAESPSPGNRPERCTIARKVTLGGVPSPVNAERRVANSASSLQPPGQAERGNPARKVITDVAPSPDRAMTWEHHTLTAGGSVGSTSPGPSCERDTPWHISLDNIPIRLVIAKCNLRKAAASSYGQDDCRLRRSGPVALPHGSC
jgi:hypothetical protein